MAEDAHEIVEVVPARAALAGNPSDGYGGAVLAVPVRSVSARVTVRPAACFEVGGARFGSLADVQAALAGGAGDGLPALVLAAIDAYASTLGRPPPCAVGVTTTIPRSAGLAGSSAVVIGVLRGLARLAGRAIPPPAELAAVALAAEVDGLGIAAGLQDRIVQCHDAPMHMEFGTGRFDRVTAGAPIDLLVAYRVGGGVPSGSVHGPLRRRFDEGDRDVREAMNLLAAEARRATAALLGGDIAALGAAMDRSFDIRATILAIDPSDRGMIERARRAGAAANFAGSGGSIVMLLADRAVGRRAREELTVGGYRLLEVDVPAPS